MYESPVRVFISYSHDSEKHMNRIVELSDRLREDGIDCNIDQYELSPPDGWARWMLREIDDSDFVLIVCTEAYYRRFEGRDEIRQGRGVKWEGAILTHTFYEKELHNTKFIPVLFSDKDLAYIPIFLRGTTFYDLSTENGYESLYRQLTNQPMVLKPQLGEHRPLPPKIALKQEPKRIHYVENVFKQSGVPTLTFVETEIFYPLKRALKEKGRGIVIEGPSGIGKTTVLRTAIDAVQAENPDFYQQPPIILSARHPKDILKIKSLPEQHKGIIAIDDFHRLSHNLQKELSDYLKYLADTEILEKKLVIVGIPSSKQKLINFGFDVATRIEIFSMSKEPNSIILLMIKKGENALNIRLDRKDEIVSISNGSLNIAQMICWSVMVYNKIEKTQEQLKVVQCDLEKAIEEKILKVLRFKYEELIKTFALLWGRSDYTCIQLLKELAKNEEGYLSLIHTKNTNPFISKGIDKFIRENYIKVLTQQYPDYHKHIFYDEKSLALAIDDPQLFFYLDKISIDRLIKEIGMNLSTTLNKVFISYSHTDSEWLKRLQIQLKPIEKKGLIDRWDDTKLKSGVLWREEIKKALDSTKIAILLVSADFLASDFIADNELPPLLLAAKSEGAKVFPVIISPCGFKYSELEKFQAVNSPSEPLIKMDKYNQDLLLTKIVDEIVEILNL
jgi:hypothetical protein